MGWRKTQRPLKQVKKLAQVTHHWKNTVRPDVQMIKGKDGLNGKHGENGKSFDFNEHQDKINALIQSHVESIKSDLKLKFSDITPDQLKKIAALVEKAKDGEHGQSFHFMDKKEDSIGRNGDTALDNDKNIYLKNGDTWILKGDLKNKLVATGGVSKTYVDAAIAAAGGGGSGSQVIVKTSAGSYTITNEDTLIVTGAGATINLASIASATKAVTIKNKSGADITVIAGGTYIDDSNTGWICNAGNAYVFTPVQGDQYYVD
jgi:hypothetical protein